MLFMKKLLSLVTTGLLLASTAFQAQALQVVVRPADPDTPGSLATTTVQTVPGETFGTGGNSPTTRIQADQGIPVPLFLHVQQVAGAPPAGNAVLVRIQTGALPLGLPGGVNQDWVHIECFSLGLDGLKNSNISTLVSTATSSTLPDIQIPSDFNGVQLRVTGNGYTAGRCYVDLKVTW
jgi:hypothetical protein